MTELMSKHDFEWNFDNDPYQYQCKLCGLTADINGKILQPAEKGCQCSLEEIQI